MLLTIGLLATLSVTVLTYWARLSGRVNQANLGWMSTQWLAEHRASNSS